VGRFCVDFAVSGRKDMYCFAQPADNWAYHVGQVAFLSMIAGGIVAIAGVRKDQKKRFAILTLLSWLPLVFVDALRKGCW